jgi:hypothetical protein
MGSALGTVSARTLRRGGHSGREGLLRRGRHLCHRAKNLKAEAGKAEYVIMETRKVAKTDATTQTEIIERQTALTIAGSFGAFTPPRLKLLAECLPDSFNRQPQGGPLPGLTVFTGSNFGLIASNASWILAGNLGQIFDFEAAKEFYGRAVDAGLAPDEISINVQANFEKNAPGYRDHLFSQLPWNSVEGAILVGSGTRYVFRAQPGSTFDFNIESDFNRPDVMLLIARFGTESPGNYKETLDMGSWALNTIREASVNVMLNAIS